MAKAALSPGGWKQRRSVTNHALEQFRARLAPDAGLRSGDLARALDEAVEVAIVDEAVDVVREGETHVFVDGIASIGVGPFVAIVRPNASTRFPYVEAFVTVLDRATYSSRGEAEFRTRPLAALERVRADFSIEKEEKVEKPKRDFEAGEYYLLLSADGETKGPMAKETAVAYLEDAARRDVEVRVFRETSYKKRVVVSVEL